MSVKLPDVAISNMCMLVGLFIFSLSTVAIAENISPANQVLPVEKIGACPFGYTTQGKYCVPGSSAKPVILKNVSCPSGYSTQGKYCVANNQSAKNVIDKIGACPSGYSTQGEYCVQN